MSGHPDAALTALAADAEQHLRTTYPHLPSTGRRALARRLAWVTWSWQAGQDAAFRAAVAGTIAATSIAANTAPDARPMDGEQHGAEPWSSIVFELPN